MNILFRNGAMVPPGEPDSLADAMLSLRRISDRRNAMGKKGRALVKARHNFSVIADRYPDVYQAVLQDGIRHCRSASQSNGRRGNGRGGAA